MTPPTTPPVLLRYSCFAGLDHGEPTTDFEVDPDGYWVKAEDALAISQALQQAREELARDARDTLKERTYLRERIAALEALRVAVIARRKPDPKEGQ